MPDETNAPTRISGTSIEDTLETEVKLTDTLIKEAEEMCDLGRGVFYEGVEEGIKQGMQQGKTAERIEMLSRYLKTGATIDEAFKLFEITDSEEQASLREALETA